MEAEAEAEQKERFNKERLLCIEINVLVRGKVAVEMKLWWPVMGFKFKVSL
jgi:hypothetical protein